MQRRVPIKDSASLIAAYRTGLKSYHPYCLLELYMESGLFDEDDLQKMKATFAKIVNVKLRTIPLSLNCEPRYIKHKPSSGAKERFMRMVEMPIVPFDLPSSNIRGFRRRQRARQLVQDEQLINIPNTDRFRPDKVFAGTFERATQGDKPVLEFDTDAQNSDIFGMDELWK
ncbi:hypothetical protein NC651_002933 [Populus alba x Populus x berolinensis]|nr:hypothetical protein NC651_002933 [Populus alba x Populus x berolinensis]